MSEGVFFPVDKNVQNKAKNTPCQHTTKTKAYGLLTYCPLFFNTVDSLWEYSFFLITLAPNKMPSKI